MRILIFLLAWLVPFLGFIFGHSGRFYGYKVQPYPPFLPPLPPPSSLPWYGYPYAYMPHNRPTQKPSTAIGMAPVCGILNGAFKTFASLNHFLEAVRRGYGSHLGIFLWEFHFISLDFN